MLEDVVLDVIRQEVLRPDVLEAAIVGAIRLAEAERDVSLLPGAAVASRLAEVERQLERLTAAIAAGGELASLVGRLQLLEAERTQLLRAVAAATRQAETVRFDRPHLDREFRARLADWRGLLGRQVQSTRQILRKLLAGRIELHPIEGGERCEVRIPLTLGELVTGVICPQGMASPTCVSWNQLDKWMRQIDGLRRAA